MSLNNLDNVTLDALSEKYRTDKGPQYHNYTPIYEKYLEPLRNDSFIFLELGIGDINSKNREGESLFMWQEYFPNAMIYGVDNDPQKEINQGRIETIITDQTDVENIIQEIYSKWNRKPRVIIDDASHINKLTIQTFKELFPYLESGGYYFVEDISTSYWPAWGGVSEFSHYNDQTTMSFFMMLTDFMQFEKGQNFNPPIIIGIPDYVRQIESISFYRNLIVIKKK